MVSSHINRINFLLLINICVHSNWRITMISTIIMIILITIIILIIMIIPIIIIQLIVMMYDTFSKDMELLNNIL